MGRLSSRKFNQFDCDLKLAGNGLGICILFRVKPSEGPSGAISCTSFRQQDCAAPTGILFYYKHWNNPISDFLFLWCTGKKKIKWQRQKCFLLRNSRTNLIDLGWGIPTIHQLKLPFQLRQFSLAWSTVVSPHLLQESFPVLQKQCESLRYLMTLLCIYYVHEYQRSGGQVWKLQINYR